MTLAKSLKTQEKSLCPAPVLSSGDSGPTSRPRRKERTTYDDFFGAAFWMFQAKSICCANLDGRKRRL